MAIWFGNKHFKIWLAASLTWLMFFSFSCSQVPKTLRDDEGLYDHVPVVAVYWMVAVARATEVSPFDIKTEFLPPAEGKLLGRSLPSTVTIAPFGFLFCVLMPMVLLGGLYFMWVWAWGTRSYGPNTYNR